MTVNRDPTTKSLSYQIDGGIVYVSVIGEIRGEEQRDFLQKILSDPAVPSPLKVLRDARKQVGLINPKNLPPFVSIAKSAVCKMAIVVSEDIVFGMARVFRARVGENVSVFRDFDEAHEWLLSDEPDSTPPTWFPIKRLLEG